MPLLSFGMAQGTLGKRVYSSDLMHVRLSFAGGVQHKGGATYLTTVILLDKHRPLGPSLEAVLFVWSGHTRASLVVIIDSTQKPFLSLTLDWLEIYIQETPLLTFWRGSLFQIHLHTTLKLVEKEESWKILEEFLVCLNSARNSFWKCFNLFKKWKCNCFTVLS